MKAGVGEVYVPEGEFLFHLSSDPAETTNLANDPARWVLLQYMRARTLHIQVSSAPSQLEQLPPAVFDAPPSPFGCWLPRDSPQYYYFVCPINRQERLATNMHSSSSLSLDENMRAATGLIKEKEGMVIKMSEWDYVVDPFLAS